ncbi:MAG: methyltransferase domain-containing protein [Alphaproteobacteria bacterium]|nr:MAG: methyltransferase domain-containing protein [Alphaproteobacteria bacterium]TAF14210.1 MAG: methyltransferase domain-containing protein [Alphaproteobacteria bacterium]TAF39332.1 MAG: methyltransferase domain-containing protein [Alphaproteobacteria bacterium]TAF76919.1 MAG: methyltransferase domain-containing protein [Alphaproteobacteria bacterium]
MHIHPDIAELRRFYSSPFGEAVRRDIAQALHRHWQDARGLQMVGVGFALPYLGHYLPHAYSVISLMLPHMGAIYWPTDGLNHSILMDQSAFPLRDESVDRILVVHAIEHSPHLHTMIQELYRIMRVGGRVLFVVPNRTGLWSRQRNNPFGYGHPYYRMQLQHRGELAGFTFVGVSSALYYPPTTWRSALYSSRYIEPLGRAILPRQGGVLIVEMEKQIYAGITESAPIPHINPIVVG